jgi:hypothetical protein
VDDDEAQMSHEVIAGSSVTLGGSVWDISVIPAKPKTSGTIYALVKLNKPGDTDHGKFWDTTSSGSWVAAGSVAAWPTATYRKGSWWDYDVPTAATTGKAGGEIVLVDLTDNLTAASSTVSAGGMQQADVVSEDRLVVSDITGNSVAGVSGNVTGSVASVSGAVGSVTAVVSANLTQIDGQATNGNNATLNLKQLNVVNSAGSAIVATSSGSNGNGAILTGNGSGNGLRSVGGTSGSGASIQAGTNSTAPGLLAAGGVSTGSGPGLQCQGGSASGVGMLVTAVGGNTNALTLTPNGSGVGLSGTISGNITGNLSGSVGSVTGAVGSVTGAVGSVTGAVGSVTGNVGGNVAGSVASVTGAVGSVTGNVGGNVAGSVASVTGAVGSVTGLTASDVGAIKAKTDNLPASPAAAGDIPSASTVASQVRTELTTELGRIDAAVTTRAAASTALSNATWTDVKAGYLDAAVSTAGGAPSAATVAAAVVDQTLSGHTTTGTVGKALSDAASGGSAPSASAVASAVRTELGTELARIDVATSTRAATGADGDTLETLSDQIDAISLGGVDVEAIVDGVVDGVAEYVGGPQGVYQVTLQARTPDDAPIVGARLSIYDETNTSIVTEGTTGSDGDVAVPIDVLGTYVVRPYMTGYSGESQELVVAGTQTTEIELTPISVAMPSDPSVCRVTGVVRDASGAASAGATVTVRTVVPAVVDGAVMSGSDVTCTTDDDGMLTDQPGHTLDLVRGATVRVCISTAGINAVYTVPDEDTIDLGDWTPD